MWLICDYSQALLVEPHKDYNLHWPIRRGRLNVHDGPCGTLTAVLSDLELIWGYAIQNMLDIPLKDLKVKFTNILQNYGVLLKRNLITTPAICLRIEQENIQNQKTWLH